ncbi:membrane-bound alkaline phosphatase [Drosophila grimshawi]|uniref:Alkaline phosphatase n=1 Tax=Drosophila grimshawi TaxID=7222 RepID=B4JRZ1_DROGR|nr:membrane-bound alkaline phosphatase [Drosophila grimshawi]EDV94531.1 GH19241 [Drosophila grimshawi]
MLLQTNVVIVIALLFTGCYAAPECTRSAEYCKDRLMHPDLEETKGQQQQQGRRVDGEETTAYWREHGINFVKGKLGEKLNKGKAKNVILFLGDGMGVTTTSTARTLLGGEEKSLSFELFPHTGLSKTYSVDLIVPDSACTATAYLCGVKAQEGTIGVNGFVPRTDCKVILDKTNYVDSIAKWAMDAGKWSGLVTTTRVTHASPAGVYAHTAERDWENDAEVANDCGAKSGVEDIAYQLINGEVGSKLKLILGGGRKNFVDSTLVEWGKRIDGLNLIEQFKAESTKNVYVDTEQDLMDLDVTQPDRILGLFQDDHMLYHMETNESTTQPTLEQMTRKAIEYMSQNDEGYFLFIEGGRIDHAHHDNYARMALDETVEFSKAIAAARELTNEEDTLLVVTADHSHAFAYAGYANRGTDVFSKAPVIGNDGIPHMILSYANGPSAVNFYKAETKERVDPTTVVTGSRYDEFPAGVPLDSETHGGDDVLVYALGPWSHLFTGVYEQNTIPHMMAYSACLGDGLTICSQTKS